MNINPLLSTPKSKESHAALDSSTGLVDSAEADSKHSKSSSEKFASVFDFELDMKNLKGSDSDKSINDAQESSSNASLSEILLADDNESGLILNGEPLSFVNQILKQNELEKNKQSIESKEEINQNLIINKSLAQTEIDNPTSRVGHNRAADGSEIKSVMQAQAKDSALTLDSLLNKNQQLNSESKTDLTPLSTKDSLLAQNIEGTKSKNGNSIPLNGKELPTKFSFSEVATFTANPLEKLSLNPAEFSSLSDTHKPLPQSSPSELAAININQLNTSGKLIEGRSPATLPLELGASTTLEFSPGSTNWNAQLGSKIRWMGKVNITSAELQLHPAELGTIEIKISTEDDQTKVSFITSNSQTKEAIEASLPKLRELLAESGLQLKDSDVSEKDLSNKQEEQNRISNQNSTENNLIEESSHPVQLRSTGQIDHYV